MMSPFLHTLGLLCAIWTALVSFSTLTGVVFLFLPEALLLPSSQYSRQERKLLYFVYSGLCTFLVALLTL